MDLLVEADTDAQVQEAVFFAVADLLNLEVDLLLVDTTSTYFERDTEDPGSSNGAGLLAEAASEAAEGFRRYGHSKDSRPDLPQIIIGLAVTREGIPVRVWCWPGNASDAALLPQVKDDLRSWRLGRVVTVVDRGFSSAANLDYLRRAGGHFIAGERLRAGTPHVEEVLARQGRYRQVRDNLRVKEVRLDAAPDLRWVLCSNPDEAARQAAQRAAALDRIRAELVRIAAARSRLATTKPTPGPPLRPPSAAARPSWPGTPAPTAHCATTPRWAAGCAPTPAAGWCSTPPRCAPRPGWMASTCWSPPTRTCLPKTSRWATGTCWRPSAASET
jgi:Transposase DDE domain